MTRHASAAITTVCCVAIAVTAFALWFDWNRFKDIAIQSINERSGRTVEINGDIAVKLSMTPMITIDDIRLGNADWASTGDMLTLKRLRFSIRLWDLLQGRVVLPQLQLYQPVLELEKQSEDRLNWQFEEGVIADAAVPDERTEFPVIGELYIEQGKIHYLDAVRDFDFNGKITSIAGHGSDSESAVELTASGQLQQRPFQMKLVAGSLLTLRDEDHPYPVDLSLAIADTQIAIRGTVDSPLQRRGLDLKVDASGPDLSKLYSLTGVVLPATPPYKVTGVLSHHQQQWEFQSIEGRIGDSDIAGSVTLETGGERYLVRADLLSKRLDFDDLGPIIGAPPATGPGETVSREQKAQAERMARAGKVIPDQVFDLSRLREADAQIHFEAQQIVAPHIPLQGLTVTVALEDAVMSIDPLHIEIADGALDGSITLDATADKIAWRYELALQALKLGELVDASTSADLASGTLSGSLNLSTVGNSMHETAANSNGSAKLRIAGGRLSNLLIELVGLDIAESVGLLITDSEQSIPFRCAMGELSVSDGIVTSEYLVVDTSDTRIDATLSADLEKENYSVTLDPHPKDISPLAVRAPLTVQGSFKEASIRPDIASLGLRAGAAVVLGTIATPFAAVLAFIEPGTGEDANCDQLALKQSQ